MPQWDFKVNNDMSNPMRAMGSDLNNLDAGIKTATTNIDKMERAMKLEALSKASPIQQQLGYMKMYREDLQRAKAASDDAAEHGFFKKLFGAEGFFAAEQIEKVVHYTHVIFEWGEKLLEAGAKANEFKEEALGTLKVMTGSGDLAEEEFEKLKMLAKGTAMTKTEVMAEYRDLFSFAQNYGTKATEDVISAGADIQKLLGTGAQQAFIGVVRNIDAMGGLNERLIRQLREVGIATPSRLYEALAGQLHTSVKGVQNLIKAGRVSKEVSINALLDLVNTGINKGEGVGFYALEKSAESVDDQLKNLKESFQDIFTSVDTKTVAQALKDLAESFNPATQSGQELRAAAQQAFEVVIAGAKFARDHMSEFLTVARGVVWTLKEMWAVAKLVTEPIALITTGHTWEGQAKIQKDQASKEAATKAEIERNTMLADELQAKLNAKLGPNEQLEATTGKFATSGENAGRAFHDKFIEGANMAGASADLHNIWKTANQEHSPSILWEHHGSNSAAGFNLGFSRNVHMALPAHLGTGFGFHTGAQAGFGLPPVAHTGFGPQSFGGVAAGGAPNINITIENKFAGGAPTTPEQTAQVNESMRQSMRNAALQLFAEMRHG
jgi:hypothetical protein